MSAPPPPTDNLKPPGTEDMKSNVPPTPSTDNNPGSYEDLNRKCKEVFPIPFEGARLLINKGLSSVFQVSHSITMSSLQPSGYKFGATYVGQKQYSPTESYPVLAGEMDLSGSLNAQIIHQFTRAIKCKYIAQIQSHKWLASQVSTEYKGSDFYATVAVANVDVLRESGTVVCNYLQNITKRLCLGAEMLYQCDDNIPGRHGSMVNFGSRYTGDGWQISGNLSLNTFGLKLCYYQKPREDLQIGVELDGNLASQECTTTLGYQVDLPKSGVVFKGQLDTNLCVGAVLEKKLTPMPFSLTLSALANHVKDVYKFGIGFTLG